MLSCWPILLIFFLSTIYGHATAFESKAPFGVLTTSTPTPVATISPEFTNSIPDCASECFNSFLETFPTSACGDNPTLECLCDKENDSGYTVGEGAVQCILSEVSIGYCKGDDAKDAVAFKAYTMCSGQANALPNTHGTLTATLIVKTSISSGTPSATTSTARSNFSGSTITASTRNPTSSVPSTLITLTSSPSRDTAPASSTTSAQVPSGTAQASTSNPKLKKTQVIGITVGTVGGLAVGIAGLIFFACWRKRKVHRDHHDSDMLPFQLDPSTSFHSQHGFGGAGVQNARGLGGTVNGLAARISTRPKIPLRLDTSSPNMFSRRSIKPGMTIGTAISPENHSGVLSTIEQEKLQRRSSKLLPEKPTLTLKVPHDPQEPNTVVGPGLSFSQGASNSRAQPIRQSTATQFEEDFDSAEMAVAADDSWNSNHKYNSGYSTDQIIQPSTGTWQTIRHVNPAPAPAPAAFFVTGGDGNHWRPGQVRDSNPAASVVPEYYVKPLDLRRGQDVRGGVGSFSQPRRLDGVPTQHPQYQNYQQRNEERGGQAVPAQLERPTTTSSSIYTTNTSQPPSSAGGDGRKTNPYPPSNHNSAALARARRSHRASGPYDTHASAGSLTSFETNDSIFVTSPQELEPSPFPNTIPAKPSNKESRESNRKTLNLITADLSPVPESPASEISAGRSPVSYPKIPARGRLPENTIRMVPPPAQPDFAAVFSSGAGKPWRAAELQAQRDRDQQRMISQSQSQNQVQAQRQFPQRMQSLQPQGPRPRPGAGAGAAVNQAPQPPTQSHQRQPSREYVAPSANFNLMPAPLANQTMPLQNTNTQAGNPNVHPAFRPQQPQRQSTAPNPPQQQFQPNPLSSHPSFTFTRSSSQQSQHSAFSQASNSSSLLAKRRGEQKAASLVLKSEEERRAANGKWRVLKKEEITEAKKEGWRPMLRGGNGRESRGWNGDVEGDLPRTPGWVPRLTPTRRGDELFLSVQ